MLRHLRILVRARTRGWANAWSRQTGGRVVTLLLLLIGVLGAAIGLGELAWEGLATPPEAVATMRLGDAPIAGENALEAAFWLSFLAAAVLGFRVMEILFRRGEMRMLERLPISPTALFFDRTLVAVGEGFLAGLPLAAFFLPLGLHGHPWAALAAAGMVGAAMLCTVGICIGANVYVGVQFGSPQSAGLGDAYGGSGGAFIYGPAAGMAASAVSILVLKLAAGEVLKAEGWSNAVGLGLAIAVVVAAGLFLTGLRDYRRSAHMVSAWFNEVDSVGFEAVIDYQKSSWAHSGWETKLPGRAGAVYRRLALELPRRHPLARWLYGGTVVAVLLGFWNWSIDAVPAWTPVALATAVVGLLSQPWLRARNLPGSEGWQRLPIEPSSERLAAAVRGAYEASGVVAGLAAATLVGTLLGDRPLDLMAGATVAQLVAFFCVSFAAFAALPYARWNDVGRGIPIAAGLALLAASFVSAEVALGAAAATTAVALPVIFVSMKRARRALAPAREQS